MPAPLLFAIVLVTAGCGAPRHEPAASAASAQVQWEPIRTWTGRGNQQLDSFPSDTGALRIEWEARKIAGLPGPGSLRVVMHSAISGRPLAGAAVDQEGEGKGEAFVSEEPRVFFANVTSNDVDWTISISERVR